MVVKLQDNADGPKKRGRKGYDWDALMVEWLKSGLPKKDFFKINGICVKSGSTWKKTAHWEKALDETGKHIDAMRDRASMPPKDVHMVVDNIVQRPVGDPKDGKTEPTVVGIGPGNSWQKIQQWRQNQAATDWKMGDSLRVHIQICLKGALQRNERGEYITTLKPTEIRQLTQAASEIQRIQRLSLGLATDNIGLDAQVETHVEAPKDAAGDQPKNVFVVELNKDGRFVRARPRRIS